MYLAGVSVRRVEDITQVLWGTQVSASTVSALHQRKITSLPSTYQFVNFVVDDVGNIYIFGVETASVGSGTPVNPILVAHATTAGDPSGIDYISPAATITSDALDRNTAMVGLR